MSTTRIVKVFVVDDKGNGLSGQRVKLYGAGEQLTNSSGAVHIPIEASTATLYVNGHTAFNGPTARLRNQEVFTRSGRPA